MTGPIKVLSSASIAILALTATATAQNVSISNYGIEIRNTTQNTVVKITNGADYDAGGYGLKADMKLRNVVGHILFGYDGGTGDLTLGGDDQDGDIRLRDTDGTTTTIDLQRSLGFIQLGSPTEDGDLRLWDNHLDNEFSINLDGGTGNVTNQLGGNGLVKAWAKIDADGTIVSCYNCNLSTAETQRLGVGEYEVDFTPIGLSILTRPVLCSNGHTSHTSDGNNAIYCRGRNGDFSSVFVDTEDANNNNEDSPFTVIVF